MTEREEIRLKLMCAALTGLHAKGENPSPGMLNGLEYEAWMSADLALHLFLGEEKDWGPQVTVLEKAA